MEGIPAFAAESAQTAFAIAGDGLPFRELPKTVLPHFALPENSAGFGEGARCFLGSGGGFFAKTLIYPYLGEKRALKPVSRFMGKSFQKHNHEQDFALGISPHTLKYTYYDRMYYPMGLCEVDIR